jgi:glycosyltransferase involved in cell wall biosynthesis
VLGLLLSRLAIRHTVALLVLKARNELGVDDTLRGMCDLVEEVEVRVVGESFASRLVNGIRLRAALLRGTPIWAAVRDAPGFRDRLEKLIREWRPDVVQLEYRITGRFLPLRGRRVPCVLVDHDPEGADIGSSGFLAGLDRRAWRSLGRAAFTSADAIVVFTERDRLVVGPLSGSTPVNRISLGYDVPYPPASPTGTDSQTILFVGSFIHPPNVDAAVWLARDIFPSVRARVESASLQLVGSHASGEIGALEGPGVAVRADVPDTWPYLDAAAIVAAPLRVGGGMRVKVLEALAAGKAVVATPLAVEGLGLKPGEQVVVCETAMEFADALVGLLTDVERRTTLARAARSWAEENLDPEAQVRAYEALYASVLGATAARGTSGPALP